MRVAGRELTYSGGIAAVREEGHAAKATRTLLSAVNKWRAKFSRRQIARSRVPLGVLLAEMDIYPWDSVESLVVTDSQRREKLRYYNSVLDCCGLNLSGSVLDLASGPFSLGNLYQDVVSVDINPQCIKEVRRNNHKGVIADIYNLPFEPGSFDYVVAIDPPLIPIMLHENGTVRFTIDAEATTTLVEQALKIARKNVVIVSYFVTRLPPHPEMIEKRMLQPPYKDAPDYVIYRANGEAKSDDKPGGGKRTAEYSK